MADIRQYFCHACDATHSGQPVRIASDTLACRSCGSELVEVVDSSQQVAAVQTWRQSPQLAAAALQSGGGSVVPAMLMDGSLQLPGAMTVTVIQTRLSDGTQSTQILTGYPPGLQANQQLPGQQQQQPPGLLELIQREVAIARQQSPQMFGVVGGGVGGGGVFAADGLQFNDLIHRLLMQHEPQSQPTPQHIVDNLEIVSGSGAEAETTDPSVDECVVCQEELNASSTTLAVVRLPRCRHLFHKRCIVPWLERAQTCPKCRQSVVV